MDEYIEEIIRELEEKDNAKGVTAVYKTVIHFQELMMQQRGESGVLPKFEEKKQEENLVESIFTDIQERSKQEKVVIPEPTMGTLRGKQ